MQGLNEYDFTARPYVASFPCFTTIDPLAEKYPHISPYLYCASNPINFIDPDGKNPIYAPDGSFLGTDDLELKGPFYILNRESFVQGMSNYDAGNLATMGGIKDNEAWKKILNHYSNLPTRPDYDGFVTVEEGIIWAKKHPNAIKHPTPDNALYIDTSQLDFGSITIDEVISKNGKVDLFNKSNMLSSIYNDRLRATVYALGRVQLEVVDKAYRLVRIVDSPANDYDWNTGGKFERDLAIRLNNWLFGIDPSIHGFKAYYYGIGQLKK